MSSACGVGRELDKVQTFISGFHSLGEIMKVQHPNFDDSLAGDFTVKKLIEVGGFFKVSRNEDTSS